MAVMPMRPDGGAKKPAAYQPPGRPAPNIAPAPPVPVIRANSGGRYARPVAPPTEQPGAIPSIESFLGGDTGYQQQMQQFAKSLSDFTADTTRRRGSLESEYGLSNKALQDQKVKDLEALEEDYGARGLIRSGLYGSAVGDYETEFGKRISDIARRQQEAMAMLEQETGQFTSQQQLEAQKAREAAIRRRAEQLGV